MGAAEVIARTLDPEAFDGRGGYAKGAEESAQQEATNMAHSIIIELSRHGWKIETIRGGARYE